MRALGRSGLRSGPWSRTRDVRGFGHVFRADVHRCTGREVERGALLGARDVLRRRYRAVPGELGIAARRAAESQPDSIYYSLTKDFVTFSDPASLYGRADRDLIDATIVKQGKLVFMFMKDERRDRRTCASLARRHCWAMKRADRSVSSDWRRRTGGRPYCVLIQNGQPLLPFDKYASGGLGALRSAIRRIDRRCRLGNISTSVFAAPIRHGSVVELPYQVFGAVALRAAE